MVTEKRYCCTAIISKKAARNLQKSHSDKPDLAPIMSVKSGSMTTQTSGISGPI